MKGEQKERHPIHPPNPSTLPPPMPRLLARLCLEYMRNPRRASTGGWAFKPSVLSTRLLAGGGGGGGGGGRPKYVGSLPPAALIVATSFRFHFGEGGKAVRWFASLFKGLGACFEGDCDKGSPGLLGDEGKTWQASLVDVTGAAPARQPTT